MISVTIIDNFDNTQLDVGILRTCYVEQALSINEDCIQTSEIDIYLFFLFVRLMSYYCIYLILFVPTFMKNYPFNHVQMKPSNFRSSYLYKYKSVTEIS